MTARGS